MSLSSILIFLHGSSYHGAGYHQLAREISCGGAATVILPNLRHGFDGLSVIGFNKPEQIWDGTETPSYSYRLNASYHPRYRSSADLQALGDNTLMLIGAADEAVDGEANCWPPRRHPRALSSSHKSTISGFVPMPTRCGHHRMAGRAASWLNHGARPFSCPSPLTHPARSRCWALDGR